MHNLEPYYAWRNHYIASEDEKSPFFDRQYSEFEYSTKLYNYYIHPQWDTIESPTLFCKILFVDYDEHYAIFEFIGEWNDCLYNDIMQLKREVIDSMIADGIYRFILIGENVLNFHFSDDCYYEEWFDEVSENDGWIALLNFRDHVLADMQSIDLDSYFALGGTLNEVGWRTFSPPQLYQQIDDWVSERWGLIG